MTNFSRLLYVQKNYGFNFTKLLHAARYIQLFEDSTDEILSILNLDREFVNFCSTIYNKSIKP